jgi:hypothetical protein
VANAPRPKPGDYTGRQRVVLQQQREKEVAEAAERMSLATAAKAEEEANTIVDYTPTIIGGVEDQGVSMADSSEVVILIEDLENMTLGAGNHYTFKAGRKYRVSAQMAQHLREKGYVY